MTLEEHIADEKQRAYALLRSAEKLKPEETTIRKLYEEGAEEHREKADLLEELKTLRRACDLACEELSALSCCEGYIEHECVKDCETHWKEYFMQKAREENE